MDARRRAAYDARRMHSPHTPDRRPRLVLEPLVPAHADEMFALLSDPQLYRYTDDEPPASLERLRERYAFLQRGRSSNGRELWLNWIVRPPGAAPVGYVQATVLPDVRTAWVAYVLGTAHWGRGYASEAVRALLDHLVDAHAIRTFKATVEADNLRSVALLERLGFEPVEHDGSPTERLFIRQARSLA